MPTIHQSDYAKGIAPVPYPAFAGHVVAHRFAMAVPVGVAQNDILELGCVPANCRPLDAVLDCDDLDSDGSPAIVFDVGMMSGEFGDASGSRTCGAEFFSASTKGQAGGTDRPTLKGAFRVSKAAVARSIGVKVTTVAATAQAGTIGVTVFYAAGE